MNKLNACDTYSAIFNTWGIAAVSFVATKYLKHHCVFLKCYAETFALGEKAVFKQFKIKTCYVPSTRKAKAQASSHEVLNRAQLQKAVLDGAVCLHHLICKQRQRHCKVGMVFIPRRQTLHNDVSKGQGKKHIHSLGFTALLHSILSLQFLQMVVVTAKRWPESHDLRTSKRNSPDDRQLASPVSSCFTLFTETKNNLWQQSFRRRGHSLLEPAQGWNETTVQSEVLITSRLFFLNHFKSVSRNVSENTKCAASQKTFKKFYKHHSDKKTAQTRELEVTGGTFSKQTRLSRRNQVPA